MALITPADRERVISSGVLTFRPLARRRFRCVQLPRLGRLSASQIQAARRSIMVNKQLPSKYDVRQAIERLRAEMSVRPAAEVVQYVNDWRHTCARCLKMHDLKPGHTEHRCNGEVNGYECWQLIIVRARVVTQKSSNGHLICPNCGGPQWLNPGRQKCPDCHIALWVHPY